MTTIHVAAAFVVFLLAWQTTLDKWFALGALDPNIPGAPVWWSKRPAFWINTTFVAGIVTASSLLLLLGGSAGFVLLLSLALGGRVAAWFARRRAFIAYREHFALLLAQADFKLPEPRVPYAQLARNHPSVAKGDLKAFAQSQASLSIGDIRRMHAVLLETGQRFT